MRATITATALLLLSLPAAAAWQANPPRRGLPAVEVSVGYPGGYIPAGYVPVELRARAGDRPFHGAIAFRFRIVNRPASNTPVIARVHLQPGQSWTFRTWGFIPPGNREIEIEWRDVSLDVVGSVRVGKLPAHARRVLHVVADGTTVPATTLGTETYAARPAELPDEAQRYTAFTAMTVPTAVWLDLPAATREAIFASGIFVVFTGTPRPGQSIGTNERALLPVTFEERPGAYRIPWPYGSDHSPVATAMSWRPVRGAWTIGDASAPYIVTTGRGAAAWAADEKALARELPAVEFASLGSESSILPKGSPPSVRQVFRSYVPMIVTILAALLSIALWLQSRRVPRLALLAVALFASILIIGAEGRILPLPDRYDVEVITPMAPGLVEHYRGTYLAGTSPIAEEHRPAEITRLSVQGADSQERAGEIRDDDTAPLAGGVFGYGDYEAVLRWFARREVGSPANVRVVSHDTDSLTLHYDVAEPVEEVAAWWTSGGKQLSGAVTVPGRKSGEVTIQGNRFIWREGAWFMGTSFRGFLLSRSERLAEAKGITVSLIHRTRTRKKETRWWQNTLTTSPAEPLLVKGVLRRAAPDVLSGLFVLPVSRMPGGKAFVSVPFRLKAQAITLTWPEGTAQLPAQSVDGAEFSTRAFQIPNDVLQRIAASGGLFEISVRTTTQDSESFSSIELWGKS